MNRNLSDQPPPWQVFPAMAPEQLGATQGAEEVWFDTVWRPFWQTLDTVQREAHHARWRTTADWRDSIDFFCHTMSAQDLADGAREAEAALARFRLDRSAAAPRGALDAQRSWIARFTGPR